MFNAWEQFYMIMIMWESSIPKTDYNFKTVMCLAYVTLHILHIINGRKPDNPTSMSRYRVCTWLWSMMFPMHCGLMISLGEIRLIICLYTLGLLHIHQASLKIYQCGHEVIMKDIWNFDLPETTNEHSISQNILIRDIPLWFHISVSTRCKYNTSL